MVFALASLPGQATMIVAQAERTRFRLYQYLPHVDDDTGARERGCGDWSWRRGLCSGMGLLQPACSPATSSMPRRSTRSPRRSEPTSYSGSASRGSSTTLRGVSWTNSAS